MKANISTCKTILVPLFDGIQAMDLCGPVDAFTEANDYSVRTLKKPAPYKIILASVGAKPRRSNANLSFNADTQLEKSIDGINTLLIPGGEGSRVVNKQRDFMGPISTLCEKAERIASVCTGSYILAELGLLDGKKATTHWRSCGHLQRQYPKIEVEQDAIFIQQDNIFTSAGISAGIDLALALIEQDLGHEMSLYVAKELVVYLRRSGGQSQFSQMLQTQQQAQHDFHVLARWLLDNLQKPITIDDMAEQCALSPRHFTRLFQQQLNSTPSKFLEQLRIEQAQRLLEQKDRSLTAVARQVGFNSVEHMRRCFMRHLKVTPSQYQQHF